MLNFTYSLAVSSINYLTGLVHGAAAAFCINCIHLFKRVYLKVITNASYDRKLLLQLIKQRIGMGCHQSFLSSKVPEANFLWLKYALSSLQCSNTIGLTLYIEQHFIHNNLV